MAARNPGVRSILDLDYCIVRGGDMAAKVEPIKFGKVCGEALELMDSGAKLGDVNRYLLDNAGHAFRYRNKADFRQLLVTYKRIGLECAAKARLAKTNNS